MSREENENWLDLKLNQYAAAGMYPFHMPGHKRQSLKRWGDFLPEAIDITEIDGFDNLHHAEGILADAQNRMAETFGAYKSFFLVNGSTAGLLSAICAAAPKESRILMARNCHKAVYHAVYLNELRPDYLYPMKTTDGIQGSIDPEDVKRALRGSEYTAVILTSPTYDGVASDIASIAKIVHACGIPLIVDEAHGAHFGFSEIFPGKAIALGADYCIESLHKTLPAYTQSAVLHIADSPYVEEERLRRYLQIFQSSSPSYVLMAGMDRCTRILRELGEKMWGCFEENLKIFYDRVKNLRMLKVLEASTDAVALQESSENGLVSGLPGIWYRDPSKILISGAKAGLHGERLMEILRKTYGLELEMAAGDTVTALTSLMDTREGFRRLADALQKLDTCLSEKKFPEKKDSGTETWGIYRLSEENEMCMSMQEAMDAPAERILLENAADRISTDFIYLYPPGIPLLTPGEKFSEDMVSALRECIRSGLEVIGAEDGRVKAVSPVRI